MPCNHRRHDQRWPCPAFDDTSPEGALAWESSAPAGDSEICSHRLRLVDMPRYELSETCMKIKYQNYN